MGIFSQRHFINKKDTLTFLETGNDRFSMKMKKEKKTPMSKIVVGCFNLLNSLDKKVPVSFNIFVKVSISFLFILQF